MKNRLNQVIHSKEWMILIGLLLLTIQVLAQSASPTPFITTWVTDDGEITIPTNTLSGTYNYSITWTNLSNSGVGDGIISGQTGDYTITGLTIGDTYEVAISGAFPHFYMNNGSEKNKLISIEQWGAFFFWSSMERAFYGCNHLIDNASDTPDLSGVTNMSHMFRLASSFNSDISDWDVSSVTTMAYMFTEASSFNNGGVALNWTTETANVTDMSHMFHSATSFNQPIHTWDVSSVITMESMFSSAEVFNQDISDWDVSRVTNMRQMFFANDGFNGPLNWANTSNVTDMTMMFRLAFAFNRDISGWDVSSVLTMEQMFNGALAFNNGGQALDWTAGTGTSNVTNMSYMFQFSPFNQDISSWDVSSVTHMTSMFRNATAFNQSLVSWDVSNISSMYLMFDGASSFNQNLGSWDISSVSDFRNMLDGTNLSVSNYDATLIGWSTLDGDETQIRTSRTLGASGLYYSSSAAPNREILTDTYFWTINGDSQVPSPEIAVFNGADNTAPELADAQSDIVDFGTEVQGADITQTFSIENVGTLGLTISSITVNDASFSINSSISTIVAGATETFTITLSGASIGSFTGDVSIDSNDADENPFTFSVSGEVVEPPAPEIDLFAGIDNTGPSISNGQVTAIDLGSVLQGSDLVQTFAIENTGTGDLIISDITSSSTSFSIGSSIGTIAAGATENFTVTLSGLTAGNFNADITITNDDADEGTFVFPVVGEITAPEISLYAGADNAGTSVTNGQTTFIDFGTSVQGADIVQTFAIENLGTADLTISNITSDDPSFTVNNTVTTIAPGVVETFSVTLSGSTVGSFTGDITISNDDVDEETFVFSIEGEIVEPAPEIGVFVGSDNTGAAIANGQTSGIDFGNSVQGTDIVQSFAIENTGTADLSISNITSSDASFSISSLISSIAAGATETFTVTLSGSTVGSFTADMTISNDDADEGLFVFQIAGEVIAPTPEIDVFVGSDNAGSTIVNGQTTVIDFGNVLQGSELVQTFAIENTGTADLSISDINPSDPSFTVSSSIGSIAPGVTETFTVTLSGSTAGSFTADITITNDDIDEGTFVFPVEGEITSPEIALYAGGDNTGALIASNQTEAVDFGSVLQGSDLVQTFAIENTGTADLSISDITSSDASFTITSSINSIAPGATEVFTVTLSGTSAGIVTGEITIANDDIDEGIFIFPVLGEITAPEINLYAGSDNTGTSIESAQTAAIDLGKSSHGTDLVQVFVIENSGTADLTISNIISSQASFAIDSSVDVIVSGATETFSVTLSGIVSGSFSADITIISDDPDEGIFVFPVTGEIEEPATPEIAVFFGGDNSGTSIVNGQSSYIDFGSVLQGSDIVQTFAIENTGTADLSISEITSSDPSFTVSSPLSTIASGSLETFTVTLSRTVIGSFTSDITITNNDADEGTFVFSVSGEVSAILQPSIELHVGMSDPLEVIQENSSVDIGLFKQGINTEVQFMITNVGTDSLIINAIESSNPTIQINTSHSEVAPNNSEVLSIIINDLNVGAFSSSITIQSNDPNNALFEFTITGIVEAEEIEVIDNATEEVILSNATVDFGSTKIGNPSTRSFVVFNPSKHETLEVEEIVIESEDFTIIGELFSILPESSAEFDIQLSAEREGSNTGEMTIVSNFADFKIYLIGEVTPEESSLKVYNVLTPNDDGKHDFFKISGINNYSGNEISIFNRAGRLVYYTKDYNNQNVRFEGDSNQGNNKSLESGAYYYVIRLGNGDKKIGFVQLIRN